jgi:hypothetical protein
MYVGVIITTCAIANLQLVVTNLDEAKTEFRQKMEQMKSYMRNRKLPSELQERILSFYTYKWTLLEGADEDEVRRSRLDSSGSGVKISFQSYASLLLFDRY